MLCKIVGGAIPEPDGTQVGSCVHSSLTGQPFNAPGADIKALCYGAVLKVFGANSRRR